MPIRPGGFDDDAAQMRVARFRDAAAPGPLAARILARDGPAVAHQLSRFGKARELADFGDDRHRRDQRDPAQRLQRFDHGAHAGRRRRRRPRRWRPRVARCDRPHDRLRGGSPAASPLAPRAQSARRSSPTPGGPASRPSSRSAGAGHAATETCPTDGAPAVDPSSPLPGRAPDRAALRAPRRAPTPASSRPRDNSARASARRAGPSSPDRPAFTGTNVGATTSHVTPSAVNCQYTTYPVGPAS